MKHTKAYVISTNNIPFMKLHVAYKALTSHNRSYLAPVMALPAATVPLIYTGVSHPTILIITHHAHY